MNKVAVIGNAAGGKTTLCKKLALSKQLSLHEVDKIQLNPGWQLKPEDDTRHRLTVLHTSGKWIIDGWGPWDCIAHRFEEADTIILIDFPLWVHLWWAAKRHIRALLLPWTLDTPEGCDRRTLTPRHTLRMMIFINRKQMPRLRTLVEAQKQHKDVFHITSPKHLRDFMRSHC